MFFKFGTQAPKFEFEKPTRCTKGRPYRCRVREEEEGEGTERGGGGCEEGEWGGIGRKSTALVTDCQEDLGDVRLEGDMDRLVRAPSTASWRVAISPTK